MDRESLWRTIQSIDESNLDFQIEVCIFANQVSSQTLKKLKLLSEDSNFKINYSSTRLPPWHSMREAISMATGDYVWLLGDDDKIIEQGINKMANGLENSRDENTDVVLLSGFSENENLKKRKLSTLPLTGFRKFDNLSELLTIFLGDLHTMNNGRFIVSRRLVERWKIQPDTVLETIHEEYRALYWAICHLITETNSIGVLGHIPPAVILGDIKKSWSDSHFKAVFGELVMIKRLPDQYLPARDILFQVHSQKRFSFKYLVALRFLTRTKVKVPTEFSLASAPLSKIHIINSINPKLIQLIGNLFELTKQLQEYIAQTPRGKDLTTK